MNAPRAHPLLKLEPAEGSDLSLVCSERWLIIRFPHPQTMVSWALVGGGSRRASTVAWYRVTESELRPPIDPQRFLRDRLQETGLSDAVGLLTSRRLDPYSHATKRYGPFSVESIATVGLGNALRAGDPPGVTGRIGTINLLCHVSVPLSEEAFLEGLALAVEARALAVREACIMSRRSGEPASGTGTDCVVMAAPEGEGQERYVGKHTVMGHLIGASVREATEQGIQRWLEEQKGSQS